MAMAPRGTRAAAPGSLALYREVKRQLVADIASGAVPPGGALASESELARRFAVSIGTVRRAVDELVADHILVRQQGRGTFVGRLDSERFMFQFFKLQGRDGSREFPQVRLVDFRHGRADDTEAQALQIAPGAAALRIENVLSLQGVPVSHDRISLAAAQFPGLTRRGFVERSGTIYELYQAAFGITVVGADERLRAEAAEPRSAELLGLALGAPVLRITRIARSFDAHPAELRVSVVDTRNVDYVALMAGQS
ncbi:MAG: GntR family transcriptional regulator [Variovorax sp.]